MFHRNYEPPILCDNEMLNFKNLILRIWGKIHWDVIPLTRYKEYFK